MKDQFNTELSEELGLEPFGDTVNIGWYDNVSKETENWWHWVVHIVVVRVSSLDTITNKEPHKHDEIRCVSLNELYGMISCGVKFAPGHAEFFVAHREQISAAFRALNHQTVR